MRSPPYATRLTSAERLCLACAMETALVRMMGKFELLVLYNLYKLYKTRTFFFKPPGGLGDARAAMR